MKNNIILVGMRASGKSIIGKILSNKLDMPLIDTTDFIIQQEGMNVKQLTDKHGWDYFLDKETNVLKMLQSRDKFILSTAGGTIVREENNDLLHELGVLYYLYARPETLVERIEKQRESHHKSAKSKTLLEDLTKVLKERKDIYEDSADHIIHTETLTPKEVADTILAYYLIANV